jgi:glycosyltransferase involved in cell wall biosynthesis
MGVWVWVTLLFAVLVARTHCNSTIARFAWPRLRYDRDVKVLHLEFGRHFYGGARQAGLLIAALSRAGIQNTLVCPSDQPLANMLPSADVITLPIGGDFDFRLSARLRRVIERTAPDLVHVHSRRGADLFGGWASAAANRPAVLTRRVVSREPAAWLRMKCRHYARTVAISSAVHDELRHAAALPERKLALIRSAVDTDLFRPASGARHALLNEFGLADDALVVAMAAQFVARKGHAFLFECLAQLRERYPNLRVLLFGRGPLERRMTRLAAALGLEACVIFCGYRNDMHALMPGIDLLVHPAEREGLGSVVLEAMSAGLPIIASAVGGIVDVIEPSRSGLLLPARDRGAWVDAIDRLLRDSAMRESLGRNARLHVIEAFSIDRMTAAYLSLYEQVQGERRAA